MSEAATVALISGGCVVIVAAVNGVSAWLVARATARNVWNARDQSHQEHKRTADKVEQIHAQLANGNGKDHG